MLSHLCIRVILNPRGYNCSYTFMINDDKIFYDLILPKLNHFLLNLMLIELSGLFSLPLASLVSPSLNPNTYNEFAMV